MSISNDAINEQAIDYYYKVQQDRIEQPGNVLLGHPGFDVKTFHQWLQQEKPGRTDRTLEELQNYQNWCEAKYELGEFLVETGYEENSITWKEKNGWYTEMKDCEEDELQTSV